MIALGGLRDLLLKRGQAQVALITLLCLFMTAQVNYLLFHTLAEFFSILVSAMIYVLATRTYRYSQNNYLLFLGYASFFVAVLNFLHMASYSGIMIFYHNGPNMSTQLWVAERYTEAISLFVAPFFIRRQLPLAGVLCSYSAVVAGLIASITWLKIFPLCYIEGEGLTTFKIVSEYAISIIIVGAIVHLYRKRGQIERSLHSSLSLAMILAVIAEILFTFYIDVYGLINFAGHILIIISNYLVFCCVVVHGFEAPYDTIFKDLKISSVTDPLTGLHNRQGFIDRVSEEIKGANDEGHSIEIVMIDIDNFKKVNDQYGHVAGDRVLTRFGRLLRDSVNNHGRVARLGGDEFVMLLRPEESDKVKRRLREVVDRWKESDETVGSIGVSIGSSIWRPGDPENIHLLINGADQEMYREKKEKKTGVRG